MGFSWTNFYFRWYTDNRRQNDEYRRKMGFYKRGTHLNRVIDVLLSVKSHALIPPAFRTSGLQRECGKHKSEWLCLERRNRERKYTCTTALWSFVVLTDLDNSGRAQETHMHSERTLFV
jgi:hypothetical protein